MILDSWCHENITVREVRRAYVHTYKCTHTHIHIHKHIHIHIHIHIRIRIRIHTYAYTNTNTYTHTHTYIHVHTHTRTHTHTCTCACTYTYIHTPYTFNPKTVKGVATTSPAWIQLLALAFDINISVIYLALFIIPLKKLYTTHTKQSQGIGNLDHATVTIRHSYLHTYY